MEQKPERGRERMEKEQTTIRLPVDLKERLQQEADKRGDSLNTMVIVVLRKGLECLTARF